MKVFNSAERTCTAPDAANASNYGEVNGQHLRSLFAANTPQLRADQYTSDHRIAKLTVWFAYIMLGALSIETGNPYIALVAGTSLWFFGINAIACLVESLRGHRHTHCWL